MNTKVLAKILAMSEAEIWGMVSPRTIRDIKREDPTPKILALVIGQEGEATPNEKGFGQVLTRWYRSAIEALTAKLGLGSPAYHKHANSNAGQNREPIGEVVGKLTKKIGDVASSIAAIYIYPQFRDVPFDIASIEANIRVPVDARSFDVEDVDVQDITGIALSNSSVDRPAFAGATLLAQLTAFANPRTPGGDEMTLEDLKKAISDGKYRPSDLFEGKALAEDPFVREHAKEEKGSEYYARKRSESEAAEKINKLESQIKDLQTQLSASTQATLKIRAKETFEAVLAERPKLKGDERLSRYVRKQFEKSFTPTDESKIKDDLNKFLDLHVAEGRELFGEPGKPGDKGGEANPAPQTNAGGKDGEQAAGDGEANPLLDPKNNDLIPRD